MTSQLEQSLNNAGTREASVAIVAFVLGNLMVIATFILALLVL
jgi:hypothetical protein